MALQTTRVAVSIPPCQHLSPGTGRPQEKETGVLQQKAHHSFLGYSGPAFGLSSYTLRCKQGKGAFFGLR